MTRFIPDGLSTWAVMTRSKDGARSLSQTSKLPGMPLVSHWSKIALSLACESLQKQAMRPFPTYKKKSWSNRSRLETFNTDQSIYIYIIIIESLYIYIIQNQCSSFQQKPTPTPPPRDCAECSCEALEMELAPCELHRGSCRAPWAVQFAQGR